jgi:hypothetical protein
MDKELKQRASESADRMTRAGMTLSAGIMQELIADAERLGEENAAEADYIRFLETELSQPQAGNSGVLEWTQELGGENPQLRELRLNHMVLAGEMNN